MRDTLPARVRFGSFELDLKSGELREGDRRVLLQEQPFKVLRMLIERDREIATREEIKKKLWPNDTIVEFDHSINVVMGNLRRALGDSAEEPQYIETLARRGYRLLVAVERVEVAAEEPPIGDGTAVQMKPEIAGLIGKKVSHYRVLEVIGGGGMGLVYKAEDLKLGRRVALKVLPEELAGDPRALERFEREARAASTLEHPNICPIYEFGEHEGQPFIVMQLLEGQTLRDRLASDSYVSGHQPFTVEQLLDVAVQIAAGLEAAHTKGIIHRDIKPANIFLAQGGVAKILDFGVAKSIEFSEHSELAEKPDGQVAPRAVLDRTLAALSLTRTGVALGTAGYMSPEQLRGETLDARTDLFSFGLVLYEMATGQRAFSGDTTEILHDAILNRKPILARDLNSTLPPKLEPIINKALEKDRNARYQRASEISADLTSLKQEAYTRHRRWRIAAAAVFSVGAIAAALWFKQHEPTSLPELKLRQLTSNPSDNPVRTGAISPDGKYLAYSDLKGIHVEQLDTGKTSSIPHPQALKGRQDGWDVVQWFPDGGGFLANLTAPDYLQAHYNDQHSSIWKFSISGDPPHKLYDYAEASSICSDGTRVFLVANPGRFGYREIWQMGPNGENPSKLFDTDENSELIGPQLLADGKRLYYLRIDPSRTGFLESRDLSGGPARTVLKGSDDSYVGGRWLPDGRLLYVMNEPDPNDYSCNVWETRVGLGTGTPSGESKRLTKWTGFCLDPTSTTADGRRLTFRRWASQGTIYLADLRPDKAQIKTPTRLTGTEGRYRLSAWTADSRAVIYLSRRNGEWGIYRQLLEQDTGEAIVPSLPRYSSVPDENGKTVPRTSPNGSLVLYTIIDRRASSSPLSRSMRVPVTGGPSQEVLTGNLYGPADCARSPATVCAIAEQSQDLKQLVFTAFDPKQGRGAVLTRLRTDPGSDYLWALSPDGTRIAVITRSEGRIHTLFLDGKPARDISVKGWSSLDRLAWAANGNGFFVSSLVQQGPVLLHVDLQGNSQVLWKQQGGIATWAVPSPDGRRLAIDNWTMNNNIWMMEDF